MDLLIEFFLISASIATPFFSVLAYRGWLEHARQEPLRWRSILGLASILLTFMAWLISVLLLLAAQIGIQVRTYLYSWPAISILIAIVGASLGFVLKGAARIQAIVAGSLMAAIWIIEIVTGR